MLFAFIWDAALSIVHHHQRNCTALSIQMQASPDSTHAFTFTENVYIFIRIRTHNDHNSNRNKLSVKVSRVKVNILLNNLQCTKCEMHSPMPSSMQMLLLF